VMLDPEATIDRMRRLRRLRVRLALDDFGTGYSSLSHLSRFPIGCVKIAKDFVDRVGDDAAGRAFVDTIVRLADSLGLETVAEGIEQRAQAETLRQLNCRFGQGFHFARPLDAAAAAEYLGHLRRAPAHEAEAWGAARREGESRTPSGASVFCATVNVSRDRPGMG